MKLDRVSLLVELDANETLGLVEAALEKEGLTLGVEAMVSLETTPMAEWLAAGATGARDPWVDPVDHLVAGLEVRMGHGQEILIRPAPRRSVGPDLIALFVGHKERYGKITRAWLRVHRRDGHRAVTEPFVWERNPPLSEGEASLLADIDRTLQ